MLTTRNPPGLITGQWAAMTPRRSACQSSKLSPASYDLPTKYGGDQTLTATLPAAIRGTSSRASPWCSVSTASASPTSAAADAGGPSCC